MPRWAKLWLVVLIALAAGAVVINGIVLYSLETRTTPIGAGMSKVVNAPAASITNDGGLEKRAPAHVNHDSTAGTNLNSAAYLFEQRVVQETGTH